MPPKKKAAPLLYLVADEVAFRRSKTGELLRMTAELPDEFYDSEYADILTVFDGKVYSEHEIASMTPDERETIGAPPDAPCEWWYGALRPATDEEILATFSNNPLTENVP